MSIMGNFYHEREYERNTRQQMEQQRMYDMARQQAIYGAGGYYSALGYPPEMMKPEEPKAETKKPVIKKPSRKLLLTTI